MLRAKHRIRAASSLHRTDGGLTAGRILGVASRPTPKLRPGPCATRSRSQRGSMSSRWT
jgi:hypothetical protein